MAHVDKKQKIDPERMKVITIVRNEYYCRNLVRNFTRSYSTMDAAKDGMNKWMLERMKVKIIEHKELLPAFSKSEYYPEMKKVAEKLEVFIAKVKKEKKEQGKKRPNWTGLEEEIKASITDSGKSIEDVYRRFFASLEFAHYQELMEIVVTSE